MNAAAPIKLSEADIRRTCEDILAVDEWRILRTEPCSDRARGKGFGTPGMPDCLCLRYGSIALAVPGIKLNPLWATVAAVMWIEWKSARGRVAAHQKEWHRAERALGALVLVAGEDFPRSIEGFLAFYRASGLMRRAI